MDTKWVDWSKSTRSKDYRGSHSFATIMIVGSVCFFLGILFASFPYDFPLLWTSEPVPPAYYDQLAAHLRFMHAAPPLIPRVLNMVVCVGFLGFFAKLFRPSEANVLFDGASLVLYLIGVGIYVANIVRGLQDVSADAWGEDGRGTLRHEGPLSGELRLSKEDSLKVLSASNTILALVLVGVLVLQAGQWYAERRELEDDRQIAQLQAEAAAAAADASGGSKKKQ
ncbi:hypothetical protein RB595_000924 [Gaeumannomyces hyphopodioides]